MEFKLEYTINDEHQVFNMHKDVITIGKLANCDFQLSDNSISRQHCKFVKTDGSYKVVDLNSTNGTFVNGRRVSEKLLREGDTVTIGRTIITFHATAREENFTEDDDQKISMVIPLSDKYIAREDKAPQIQRYNVMANLTVLSKELIACTSLEETFEKVGGLIYGALSPKRLFIFSYDEKQEDLELKHFKSKKEKDQEKTGISKTIAFKAIREKVAILSSNTQDDSRFNGAQSIIMYGIRSAVSVPVWTKNAIYGLIYIDTTEFDHMFEEKDLEILTLIANFTGLTLEGINNLKKLEMEKKLRARLERYHSPAVVTRIMDTQGSTTMELMAYRETEASVFFMDIVGFTSRVEKMNAVEIGVFLNSFFTEMTDVVFTYHGTLDKYIGDCIMAVFGVPFEINNHAELSIMAALDMMEKLAERNSHLKEADRIQVRIGINSGKLVAGDFGSHKRLDYTVLGNTVNIASRLESIAGSNEIVVSGATYEMTRDKFEFQPLGTKDLKGLTVPVAIYKVMGKRSQS